MADTDLLEPDQLAGAPHPREQAALFGHAEAEAAFLDGVRSRRLHHAWLIGGPEGIGKATLAYRVARFLLAHGGTVPPGATTLAVDPQNPAARQVAARSHPDLAVVRRGLRKDGKGYSQEIGVDHVRRALDLFASTAGRGGYRVCMVDAADDLNASSGNALLKVIEEPPPRSVFLVVSHAPQRLLPTIRSRCRKLQLRPLSEPDLLAVIRSLGPPWADTPEADLSRAAALAEGSVRRAIEMLDEDKAAIVAGTEALLSELPRLDMRRVVQLAEKVSPRGTEGDLKLALDTAMAWVSKGLEARAAAGPARLAPLVEVCEKVARAAREAEIYNLDKRPVVIALFGDLAEAVRRAG
ncbi:MAG TPA: DNA polymerase III subunit delta' [Beijerinckiaceae bacterium]|jgi:DNA polymerase-3 subunit delta'